MIVDHHNHLWVGERTGESFLDQPMSVERILIEMDRDGVDKVGVCSLAEDVQNDYILKAQQMHPDRLFGYCFINPRNKNAVVELRRYLGEGLHGMKLHPRYHGYPLDSLELVGPLMEVLREFKVPMFSHGAGPEEFNTPLQFEQVAMAYSDVPVILGHMGAIGVEDAAIRVAKRNPNIYLDTSVSYMGSIVDAINVVGADRILMSTDWPANPFRLEQMKIRLATENDPVARRKIMGIELCQTGRYVKPGRLRRLIQDLSNHN